MKTYPKISIITPSLNQGQFIEKTILSILSQSYPNLEYFIVDGGSTDDTLKILEKYTDRLTWFSEPDRGQTDAINKGLRRATGDIVAYLNSDDILLPNTLLEVGAIFAARPQSIWVTGQCLIIDENDREVRRFITTYKNILLRLRSFSLLLITDYISQPATFWRRNIIEEIGMPNENLHYVMDYDFWLRLYSKYPPIFIPKYLASFRVHKASKTTTNYKNVFVDEEQVVIQNHTRSFWLKYLHHAHRALINFAYSILNR